MTSDNLSAEMAAQIVKQYIIPTLQRIPKFKDPNSCQPGESIIGQLVWLSKISEQLEQTRKELESQKDLKDLI